MKQNLPSHTYVELSLQERIENQKALSAFVDIFLGLGFDYSDLVIFNQNEWIKVAVYMRSLVRCAMARKQIAKCIKTLDGLDVRLKTRVLKPEFWRDKWQREYRIMRLGSYYDLVPEWQRKDYREGKRMPIYLDPHSSFGSGTHETTGMMVELIGKLRGKFSDFLDLGTGTGILSVAALRAGAGKIVAVDIERDSVKTARSNLKNNLAEDYRGICSDVASLKLATGFDLVAANLFTDVLIREKKRIVGWVKPGQYLIISGVMVQHRRELRRGFDDKSLKCLKVLQRGKWTAYLFKRRTKKG